MRSLPVLMVFTIFMAAMLMGCGSKNVGLDPGASHGTSGLTLKVLPGSFYGGAAVGEFTLEVTDYGDSTMVDIKATGAEGLRGIYFDLEYDAQSLRPMMVEATSLLGDADEMATVQIFSERGHIHYGQMLLHPDLRPGFTGDGVVAQVLFKNEPALNTKLVSSAPSSPSSAQIVDANLDTSFSWWYSNQGDHDQNGEVNIADITPLVIHFQKVEPVELWSVGMVENVVDGDGNGEINLADITTIVLNFGNAASTFHIYTSPDPADYTNDTGTLVQILGADGIVDHSAGVAATAADRLRFSIPIADIDGYIAANWYWVYPAEGTDLGIKSNRVGGEGIALPFLTLLNVPADGEGIAVNPYQVDDITDYNFTLTDPDDGNVTNHANTIYTVSNGAGVITKATDPDPAILDVVADFTGTFSVDASYNSFPAEDKIYFIIDSGPATGLFIMKDETDADWSDVNDPGGTDSNPSVLGNTVDFNIDYSVEFSMVANTQADGLG